MSEYLTACENIAEDFHWVPEFLAWFGSIISDFGPIIAIFGGVYIFFNQRKADREAEKRRWKSNVYSDFLGVVEKLYVNYRVENYDGGQDLARLFSLTSLVSLAGADSISSLVENTTSSLLRLINEDYPSIISRDGKNRTKVEDFFWERRQLLAEMKRELRQ